MSIDKNKRKKLSDTSNNSLFLCYTEIRPEYSSENEALQIHITKNMAAIINVIPDNQQEDREEETAQHPQRTETSVVLQTKKHLLMSICQSSSVFVCLIMITTIPILELSIGWRYSNACPVHQLIPHYLIIAGIVSLLLIILIAITQLMTGTCARKMFDEVQDSNNPNRTTMLVGCGVCSIMCINLSLFMFLVGWSFAGWIWTIEVWHAVQYHSVESSNYCHPTLYRFTFFLLLVTTTLKTIFFCFICERTCVKAKHTRRKDTITSEDYEHPQGINEHNVR